MNNQQLWQAILGNLELSLSKANFNTWFKNTSIIEKGDDSIIVSVPSIFIRDWIVNKYKAEILKTLKTIAPEIKEVKYQVGTQRPTPILQPSVQNTQIPNNFAIHQNIVQQPNINGLNPRYTFETFVVGKNNELAHAAGIAISKTPGSQYNPLFLYGGVGLGKTHLMQAAANQYLLTNPKARILYVTSEKFTNDFVHAIQNKKMDEFKRNYRLVDILLVDDIQFIAGKETTQEEFFHTFNEIRDRGKQIIITSDRLPKDIPGIEQRLISRFEWGMVADIQAPELETRMAILRAKMEKRGAQVSEEILYYIAEHILHNVRELEGALNRLMVYQQMENRPLHIDQAKQILAGMVTSKKKTTSLKKIGLIVAEFYNITTEDILKQSRKKEFVKPRQIAMYLARKELDSSFPTIGEFFGGRDHTTVMHAVEKVNKLITGSEGFKQEVDLIMDKLYTS
jgi:chromosomal replication initiator protein